jgi:hypothetical protein
MIEDYVNWSMLKFEKQELKKIIKYTRPHHSFNDKLVDYAQFRGVRDMVLKTTFTNISVISWWLQIFQIFQAIHKIDLSEMTSIDCK